MSGDGDKTRGDSPRARTHGSPSSDASQSTSLLATAARQTERVAQRRVALIVATVLSGLGALALQFSETKPTTHWVLTALLGVTCLASALSFIVAIRSGTVPPVSSVVNGVLITVTTLAAIAHVGALSALACLLPVIIYYFAFGDSRIQAVGLFALSVVGYATVIALACVGLVPLRDSLVAAAISRMQLPQLALIAGFVEAILIATFFMARRTRRATLDAMQELEMARRRIEHRDALLDEARADLDYVMELGRVGRLSGVHIGPWHANEVIGRGGMSEIYRAVHRDSGQRAAVKVLHASVLAEPTHVERFFREARVSSALKSPHIVETLDNGYAADGTPYLAMELLEGLDLARLLREHKRLALSEALELVTHVSHALAKAHDAGIVHRDLKPQNLFRSFRAGGEQCWKVLDFGISKISEAGSTLTHGAVVGTPRYMSPEQARGHPVDRRSDVFSLGVVAYRMLTGRPPFAGHDSMATMYQVMHVQPVCPGDFMKEHQDVDLVLALALAKDRDDRFGSAAAFAGALGEAAQGELDARFRDAARELLARAPWGSEIPRRA